MECLVQKAAIDQSPDPDPGSHKQNKRSRNRKHNPTERSERRMQGARVARRDEGAAAPFAEDADCPERDERDQEEDSCAYDDALEELESCSSDCDK